MDLILAILTGALIGWLAHAHLGLNEARGRNVSIALGVAGALIGVKAIAPIFFTAPAAALGVASLLIAAGSAAAFIALGHQVYARWGV